ncbi:MAG: biotin/lipoyl-containing protein [Anaerolineales bacterium]|jgi:biotin carboxyl carrier protein
MGQSHQEVRVTVDGESFLVKVEDLDQNPVIAYVDGVRFEVALEKAESPSGADDKLVEGKAAIQSVPAGTSCQVTAPMPGDIIQILVKPGQAVQTGEPLCVLDAMKMKNTIHAPQAGSIAEICVKEGQSVEFGTPLFGLG